MPVDGDDFESSDDEYSARKTLEASFKTVSMDPGGPHFFGKSSSVMFLQKAMDIRQEYVKESLPSGASEATESEQAVLALANFTGKRLEFWNTHPVSVEYFP